jgi:hypothetical protein
MFARFKLAGPARRPSVLVVLLVVALLLGLGLWSGGLLGDRSVQAAPERHPHIRAALEELREAKRELEKADHDFGGHRKEAIKAIDEALIQLEKALKFDKK